MEKRIDLFFKGFNEVDAPSRDASRSVEEFASRTSRASNRVIDRFRAMDQAQKKFNTTIANRQRQQSQKVVEDAQLANLRRAAELGDKAADMEAKRTQITREFLAERRKLLRVVASSISTDKQKAAAQRELIRLESLHKQRLAGLGVETVSANRAAEAVRGLVGAYLGFHLVSTSVRRATESVQAHLAGVLELQREIKELISLGGNVSNQGAIRSDVLRTSNVSGRERQEIADLMFFIQSGTANQSDAIRQEIINATVGTGEFATAELSSIATSIIKTFEIYGDEVKTVARAQDLLFTSSERGFQTYEDLASLLPRVLPAAKAMGFTLQEVLGTLVLGTRVGGQNEITYTSLRNIILRFNNAQKHGIELTGTLADKLEQLAEVDPNTLKEIFGDRTVSLVLSLIDKIPELRKEIEELGNTAEGVLAGKLTTALEDEVFAVTRLTDSARTAIENKKADPTNIDGLAGDYAFRQVQTERYLRDQMGMFHDVAYMGTGINAIDNTVGGSILSQKGLREQYREALSSNNFDLAEAIANKIQEIDDGSFLDDGLMMLLTLGRGGVDAEELKKRVEGERAVQEHQALLTRYENLDVLRDAELFKDAFIETGAADLTEFFKFRDALSDMFRTHGTLVEESLSFGESRLAELHSRLDQQEADKQALADAQERENHFAPLRANQQALLNEARMIDDGQVLQAELSRITRSYAKQIAEAGDEQLKQLLEQRRNQELGAANRRGRERHFAELERVGDVGRELLQATVSPNLGERLALEHRFKNRIDAAGNDEERGYLHRLLSIEMENLLRSQQQELIDLETEVRKRVLIDSGDRLGAQLLQIEADFAKRLEAAQSDEERDLLRRLRGFDIADARDQHDGLTGLGGDRRTPDALLLNDRFTGLAERYRSSGVGPEERTAINTARMLEEMEQARRDRQQARRNQQRRDIAPIGDEGEYLDLDT